MLRMNEDGTVSNVEEATGGTGITNVAPQLINEGDTFVVEAGTQVMYLYPIYNQGDMVVDGALIDISGPGPVVPVSTTPYKIEQDDVFTVPEESQIFYRLPISINGDLNVDGYLIEV